MEKKLLLEKLDRLHTTALGEVRIRKNLGLGESDDPVAWCKGRIAAPGTAVTRRGKNLYAEGEGFIVTVNAKSLTLITAHRRD